MQYKNSSIYDLSPPEKLQLVEDIWDDLAASPADVPVHQWQKDELDRRKDNLKNSASAGLSWDEIKTNIRNRYDR